MKSNNSSQSNSKSEDTLSGTYVYTDGNVQSKKTEHVLNTSEPPQDTTIQDVVDGTPKGQEAVRKAMELSIQDQNGMTRKAQDTILDVLEEIRQLLIHKTEEEKRKAVLAWHKAEIAKLFEQIRSEVIGSDIPELNIPQNKSQVRARNRNKAEQREALTRLEKDNA